MEELFDGPFRAIVRFLLGFLRVLFWLAWDLCIEMVGWAVGWIILRCLSVGRYPQAKFSEQDSVPLGTALFVEFFGIVCLALAITLLGYLLGVLGT